MSYREKPNFTPFVDVSSKLPDIRAGATEATKEAFTAFGTTRGNLSKRAASATVAFMGSAAMQSGDYVASGKGGEVLAGMQQNLQAERERRKRG